MMTTRSAALAALIAALPVSAAAQANPDPKVLVVTMFDGETQPWLDNLDLTQEVAVPGLPESAPALHCDADMCVITTTMGFANAASSIAALAFGDAVELDDTYIIVAGISGVDPDQGTLGSAHWAQYVIDAGLMHRIDVREVPNDWETGILPLGTTEPGATDGWSAGTEMFELNSDLTQRALELTQDVDLADSDQAASYRAQYSQEAAQRTPFVSACDTMSGDTYWHGEMVAGDMEDRVARLTDGQATYCTTQMEDNATLTALERAAAAGRADFDRIAIVRTGSNFDRQHDGQTAVESLSADSGGYGPAIENAFRVGNALAQEIIGNWDTWQDGVPAGS